MEGNRTTNECQATYGVMNDAGGTVVSCSENLKEPLTAMTEYDPQDFNDVVFFWNLLLRNDIFRYENKRWHTYDDATGLWRETSVAYNKRTIVDFV